jgi:predicted nucleotidyltransferase
MPDHLCSISWSSKVSTFKLLIGLWVKMVRMRPSEVLPQHRDAIRRIVLDSGMANPRLFGSVVHGDDSEDSDLDLLVDPSPETSLLDIAKLQIELEATVGLKVDIRTPKFLPETFREKVLAEAVPV